MTAKKLFIILGVLIVLAAIVVALIRMKNQPVGSSFVTPTPPRAPTVFPYEEPTPLPPQEVAVVPTSPSSETSSESTSTPSSVNLYQDSDNDGTPDWEEALKGTNTTSSPTYVPPQTSSSTSGSYTVTTSTPKAQTPSPTPTPSTSTPTSLLFPTKSPELLTYANDTGKILSEINDQEEAKLIGESVVQLPPGKTLLEAITESEHLTKQEAAAIAPFLPQPVSNDKASENLMYLSQEYKDVATKLKSLAVPATAKTAHAKLVAAYESRSNMFSTLSSEKKRANISASSITRFNKNSTEILDAFYAMGSMLKQNKITLTPTDAGFAFMAYYQ